MMFSYILVFSSFFVLTVLSVTMSVKVENIEVNSTYESSFTSFTLGIQQILSNNIDYQNPNFISSAKQLKSRFYRVGGTPADYVYYQVGGESHCNTTNVPQGYYCMTKSQLKALLNFSATIETPMVFGLSVGYPLFPTDMSIPWNYTNVQSLLLYLKNELNIQNNSGSYIYGFQLGNELDSKDVTWEWQSDAFKKLNSIMIEIWGETKGGFTLHGPDVNIGLHNKKYDYLYNFVLNTCQNDVLNCLDYHSYIELNTSNISTYQGLNKQYEYTSFVSSIFVDLFNNPQFNNSESCINLYHKMWSSEINEAYGTEYCGNYVCQTYLQGFWYIDALGTLASLNNKVFALHTLQPSQASFLAENTYKPYPIMFIAILHKDLTSKEVILTTSNNPNLRVYSFCGNTNSINGKSNNSFGSLINPVVIIYISLFTSSAVSLEYDSSVLMANNGSRVYFYEFMTSDMDTFLSEDMILNGNALEIGTDGKYPNLITMGTEIIGSNGVYSIKQESYGYLLFTQTTVSICS